MKKHLTLLLKIVVSAAILTFLFFEIPINEIIESLGSANFVFIFISFCVYIIYHILSAYETRYLTDVQGISITTFQIMKVHLTTMFYNLFIPGFISAGAVKWYKFSRYGSKSDAAAVVAFNRFLETLVIILTGIIFSIPIIAIREQEQLILIFSIFLLITLIIYFLILNQKFISLLEKITLMLPFPQFVKKGIIKLFSSLKKFKRLSLKENAQIFGLLFVYHTLGIAAVYLLALSLNLNITFFDIAWIRAAVNILTMLPLSFAGLGIREVSIVFFLGKFGIKADAAMAFSILIFLNITLLSLLGGIIEFYDFISDKKIIAGGKANQNIS